jgi:hypothetical protein
MSAVALPAPKRATVRCGASAGIRPLRSISLAVLRDAEA